MEKNFVLMILLLFVVACAAGQTQSIRPKKLGFKNYTVLEMPNFENNGGPQVPTEVSQWLPNAIAEKVTPLSLFQTSTNSRRLITGIFAGIGLALVLSRGCNS